MKIKYKVKEEKWVPCTVENAVLGATVKKGSDWSWGNQDKGNLANITDLPFKDSDGEFWINVQWNHGTRNGYRVSKKKDLLIKLN